jgi:glycosyltransferase involved in cell wall biosynthesis
MKILFPLIRAGSGSDIFTANLISGLKKKSISAQIYNTYPWSVLVPAVTMKMMGAQDYDIIHGNTWNGLLCEKNIPFMVTEHHVIHDPTFLSYKTKQQILFHKFIFRNEKLSLNRADRVTCVSNYTQKKLEQVFGLSDSRVIYNGIDTQLFRPLHQVQEKSDVFSKKTILFYVGNLSNRKGADLLIPIMKELDEGYHLFTTTGLRGFRNLRGVHIKNLGKITLQHLIRAYNFCDIFLFPSRLEGFGLSVAEAMSCGKPVVTTDCSSLPELVVDGKGGYLCPMNDVQAFADAIRHLAEDENISARMGKFNRQRVLDMFTIDKMTREYIHLYQGML